jgi:hypothetical protein
MSKLIQNAAIVVALSASAFAASAASLPSVSPDVASGFSPISARTSQSVRLQSGATLHVYQDGKMAAESALGRPMLVQPGQVLTTADGRSITMVGDEVARLSAEIRANNHR